MELPGFLKKLFGKDDGGSAPAAPVAQPQAPAQPTPTPAAPVAPTQTGS